MQKIKVKVSARGQVEYEVQGVKGKSCKELTRAIDQIVGGDVLETRNTAEFCELPTEAEREKARR